MKAPFRYLFYGLFAILLLSDFDGVSQEKAVLQISKKHGDRVKEIKTGKRVKIVMNSGETIKGRITMQDGELLINNQMIDLDQISVLRTKSLASTIVGGVFVGFGSPIELLGGVTLIQSTQTSEPCERASFLIAGVALVSVGTVILIPGALFLLIGKKHKAEKWSFSVVDPNAIQFIGDVPRAWLY